MYGLFTQWRVASWVSLFFGIVAQVNTGRNASPAGGGMNAIIFSIMALMISLANQFFPQAFSGSWFGAGKKT
ncbi:hypothetical protein M427DRAFT_57618 [Gonapodya prolifera JEL478]|uniref:Uncharacterized protein n=1 Tax=Gonapodya prolifera (strain JEL478) TaxID=1344416 RepID=A0A139AC98_GONPJ|nr:hypothetical protein M427DRAFT_57618 [Gonapodya prolifera JEL478]|eukprot:KXS14436.1 hypothetical protein M427DRAFT_57618 [Gonapodya prolifera JEL478]